ncbi:hypothetical protein Ddye_024241 [Dipteronia dyeriana]|uniref:Eukaryotic initiation factor 4a n=1 Tax=Dipteronia dyeriana TaxID=168575 RepID=A0AAD9TV49_9ROSI|nr:hypothetical protein Ddye_024241 [Dipteronia dyeriana]
MAIDGIQAPSPPSQSQSISHFGQPRHFYVAVDRLQFKMQTLVDLLGEAGRHTCLPMVVCCSSRDELDAVSSVVSNLPYISFSSLYSDLVEAERTRILVKFREATVSWNQNVSAQLGDDSETGKDEQKSLMIVVTDACLPVLASGESPISARVLINYALPMKKETYMRRIATCLAADGVVINMVVGGEVVTLKSIEESSNLFIAEMPINVSEIL